MTENEEQQAQNEPAEERPSLTSPPGGKTHEATTPPGQGDLDEEAADRSREGLERAAGGDG